MAALTAQDRCDRCGAQAYAKTAHTAETLLWCAHHFRKHEQALTPFLVHLESISVKEAAPA